MSLNTCCKGQPSTLPAGSRCHLVLGKGQKSTITLSPDYMCFLFVRKQDMNISHTVIMLWQITEPCTTSELWSSHAEIKELPLISSNLIFIWNQMRHKILRTTHLMIFVWICDQQSKSTGSLLIFLTLLYTMHLAISGVYSMCVGGGAFIL